MENMEANTIALVKNEVKAEMKCSEQVIIDSIATDINNLVDARHKELEAKNPMNCQSYYSMYLNIKTKTAR